MTRPHEVRFSVALIMRHSCERTIVGMKSSYQRVLRWNLWGRRFCYWLLTPLTAYFYLPFFPLLFPSTPQSPFGHKCSQHLQTKCYTLRMFYTLVPTLLFTISVTLLLLTLFFFHRIPPFVSAIPFLQHFYKYLQRILALLTPFVSIKIAGDLLLRLFITLIRTHSWNSCCSLQYMRARVLHWRDIFCELWWNSCVFSIRRFIQSKKKTQKYWVISEEAPTLNCIEKVGCVKSLVE